MNAFERIPRRPDFSALVSFRIKDLVNKLVSFLFSGKNSLLGKENLFQGLSNILENNRIMKKDWVGGL